MDNTRRFQFEVDVSRSGARLDVFLASSMKEISRSRVQKLIESGYVIVNGQPAVKRMLLQPGDTVSVQMEQAEINDISPEPIEIEILFEDQHLTVLNKPRGLAVHPGAGRHSGTLVNALAYRYGKLPEASAPERPGIVHRLDKDTSGLMIVARTPEMMTRLASMISAREVTRKYHALVWGSPRFEKAVVDAAIGRDPRHPERMAVLPEIGPAPSKSAETFLNVIERFGDATLLEAKLTTGRTHQIRVHCAYSGHDIVGDTVYGKKHHLPPYYSTQQKERFSVLMDRLNGQALHAYFISFRHPVTSEELSFEALEPTAMQDVIDFFRSGI